MTEAAAEAPVVAETPPEAGTPAPAGTTPAAKPEWLGEEKVWDAEAGKVNDQGIYQSYRELQSAFGKRIGDMSPEARKKLAEMVPDEMRATWAEETKAAFLADEEALKPLRDAWLAESDDTEAFFGTFGDKVPDELHAQLETLREKLRYND